jgi:hypothetical protein
MHDLQEIGVKSSRKAFPVRFYGTRRVKFVRVDSRPHSLLELL